VSVVRRRSRRRKSSYRNEDAGTIAEPKVEDLSPRAKRLVESGVIDLSLIAGSGEGGRITSGDILHAARVMEMEQSVARIETVGRPTADHQPDDEMSHPEPAEIADVPALPESPAPTPAEEMPSLEPEGLAPEEPAAPRIPIPSSESEATTSSATDVGGEPIAVPPNVWEAYNGSSDGLSESALPGAEQSWGEAEANIAAIAEEAAAQLYGRPVDRFEPLTAPLSAVPDADGESAHEEPLPIADAPLLEPIDTTSIPDEVDYPRTEPAAQPLLPEPKSTGAPPVHPVAPDETIEALPAEPPWEPEATGQPEHMEVMMDFGTLELVDPVSVWAEGAEDFAPWFLANSKQLGDVLGLEAGLSEPRQYTTKSASGVIGRDDNGEDVVVLSSQEAAADDSDLGRALGMAASSGAATVALVSATFGDEQLQALTWLNSQTKTGVKWFGIEMRVVRIADSPPAMMFNLVAAPPQLR
jgi:hypothetical protein